MKSRGWAGATEVFQFMTLVESEPHLGMQAEALLIDAAL